MSTQHTPGPWSNVGGFDLYEGIAGADGKEIALLTADRFATRQADARLIAAAPDLLAAGQALLDLIENYHPLEGTPSLTEQAGAMRKAIAKAEGRP